MREGLNKTSGVQQHDATLKSGETSPQSKFKPYPEYKDSGVEWLGKIPAHWEVAKIKYSTYVKGRIGWQGLRADEFTDEGPYCVTGTDFKNGEINWETCYRVSQQRYLLDSHIHLREGDLLITKDGTIGKTAIVYNLDNEATLNSGIFLTRPLDGTYLSNFLYWVLNSLVFKDFFSYKGLGSTIIHLYQETFEEFIFPKPKIPEQQAIITFLNRETAKIDALISKKKKLIELLQEKRTALISQAVTKGLNPNVPMKDSGIEWLGKIPAHWEIVTLKRIGNFQAGAGFPENEQGIEGKDLPFYKVGDMGVGGNEIYMSSSPNTISYETAKRLRAYVFPPQTIVFAKVGAALLLNRRRILTRPSCIDNNMMGFMPKNCEIKWAFYWLTGLDLSELANPGAVPSVNEEQMRDIPVALPTNHEQKAISSFLDRETSKIDALILKIQEAIDRLKEYRTALISAAVTGKIDVRNNVGARHAVGAQHAVPLQGLGDANK